MLFWKDNFDCSRYPIWFPRPKLDVDVSLLCCGGQPPMASSDMREMFLGPTYGGFKPLEKASQVEFFLEVFSGNYIGHKPYFLS